MSRHDPEPAMRAPWKIIAKPDRPGGGYLLASETDGGKVRVYGTRADVDLIIDGVNQRAAVDTENLRLRWALEAIAEMHAVCSPYAAGIAFTALGGDE